MAGHFEIQSCSPPASLRHVAIIPDGNGRWARRRGLPRSAGHRAGARVLRDIVASAARTDLEVLSVFAFSADNWQRPKPEVEALMDLFERFLAAETARCRDKGVRLNFIGRRRRLRPRLLKAIEHAEEATREGRALLLRIAVDYSARRAIARAATSTVANPRGQDSRAFEEALLAASHSLPGVPPVDLLIRTSGETRLSDFLLWECAYAELYFTRALWPDFTALDLQAALDDYRNRDRRFGRAPELSLAGGAS